MKHTVLTEKELEGIFSGKKAKQEKAKILKVAKYIFSFFVITGIFFVTLNFSELSKNINYWYKANFTNQKNELVSPGYDQQLLSFIADTDGSESAPNLPPLPTLADNNLTIPSIGVTAPITWKVQNEPAAVTENLKNGLIQIDGTALPGEIGNVFITGHSSNYPWIKSPYNSIFALLNKVAVGDVVHLKYKNVDYLYRVSSTKVTNPDDLSVMKQTSNPILTLMTCTPVGTNLRRLIVVANQYYPDPSKNTTTSASNKTMRMPKKVR